MSRTAKQRQKRTKATLGLAQQFIANYLKRQGAIDAVARILKYGRNEANEPLRDTKWFRQQLRLTCDKRLKHALTTGASQVSKSLANYLDLIDTVFTGQINAGWFYASRQSMHNQQPEQMQKLSANWIKSLKKDNIEFKVNRDAVTRYSVGVATANFTYANSASESKSGGASEGKESASFQASILYLEEKSSWKQLTDVSPRLGASVLMSKPIRELGTPGSGAGIERAIENCKHVFVPGLPCPSCKQITFLDPKGALLKSVYSDKKKEHLWFSVKGEILDYHTKDGTPDGAYVACIHCEAEITPEQIDDCELYSKVTLETVDQFLDNLPEDEIYTGSVGIYLSPLLRVPTDPYRVIELVKEGLDPVNPKIYQENKLGHASVTGSTGVSLAQYLRIIDKSPIDFDEDLEPKRFLGIDQGTDFHYAVILETCVEYDQKNILLADAISEDDILDLIAEYNCDFAVMDVDPFRKSAYELSQLSDGKLVLADQRTIDSSFKEIKVTQGSLEIPCYAVNNQLHIETVIANWNEDNYRINGKIHPKFQKHVTSIKRNLETGMFERPVDHDDDLFFGQMFAEIAAAIYPTVHRNLGTTYSVGNKYKTPSYKRYGR
jgi:hypothetical protein